MASVYAGNTHTSEDRAVTSSVQERQTWADTVRVFAIFGIVMLHLAAVPCNHFDSIPRGAWWWANLYDALPRAGVPIFVMLSGALLLNRPRTEASEMWRRVLKIAAPLVLWTLIYTGWRAYLRGQAFSMPELARHLLNGMDAPVYPHLWFLYVILGLYLFLPVLRPFVAHASPVTQIYFVGLWLIATILQPLFERRMGYSISISLAPAYGFIGYFVLGAALHKFVPMRLPRRILWGCAALFLAGLLVAIFGTFALSLQDGKLNEFFYEPLSLNVIAMAASAFLLVRHHTPPAGGAAQAQSRFAPMLARMSMLAFGIYLIHPMVIDCLDLWFGLSLDPLLFHPSWYVPALALLVFILSAVSTALLVRTPLLRWLVP
jgi:surface polysaccharide O-acyltransferase-like enzyme